MLQEVSSGSFYRLCCILISFFVLRPSLKHMSERQWGYIYRPVPPLSTLAPSLLPAPSLPQHICAVGMIYSCRKNISLSERYFSPQHNFRPFPTRPAQDIFLSSIVRQISHYLHILFHPVQQNRSFFVMNTYSGYQIT